MPSPFTLELLSRPLGTLSAADLQALVRAELPEGESVEFKERLSTKRGEPDVWDHGTEQVGIRARDALLHEVIAFANARGGHVIVGVVESADHPKRAVGLRPIQRCADLADRVMKQARDLVEPPLPTFEARGIATGAQGEGILILRVPASRNAPHWHRETREVLVRRGDRSERMSMRDIQELTLQRAAEASRAETELANRTAAFNSELDKLAQHADLMAHYGVRVSLVPALETIRVPRDWMRTLQPHFQSFVAGSERQMLEMSLPCLSFTTRPVLRGERYATDFVGQGSLTIEILESGLVEYQLLWKPLPHPNDALSPEWVIGLAFNAMAMAHATRLAAGAPSIEYIIEIELGHPAHYPIELDLLGRSFGRRGTIQSHRFVLPRYSFGAFEELGQLVGLVASDCMNAAGVRWEPEACASVGPMQLLERMSRGESLL